jgi:hypothetical protein
MSYVRVAILGSTNGGEVWSVNPVYDPTGEFPGGVSQSALDSAAAAIAALSPGASLLVSMSQLLSVTGARVEVRDDSNDSLIGIATAARSSALPGTNSPVMPPQCASVYSLRTNTPGASGRGRLYWPTVGVQLDGTGRIDATTRTAYTTAMKAYLAAIQAALATAFPTIGFDLAVRSKTTHTTPHVTRMQLGSVVDTQRRRRDKLTEAYTTVTIP